MRENRTLRLMWRGLETTKSRQSSTLPSVHLCVSPRRLKNTDEPSPCVPGSPELIEELSLREIEILDLISQGFSNQDISEKLFLSLGTVKWHTSNIYGKLGVRGRTQAVARARQMNILK